MRNTKTQEETFRQKLAVHKQAKQHHSGVGYNEFGEPRYLNEKGVPISRCFDLDIDESIGPRCALCKMRRARLGYNYTWMKYCQPCIDKFKASQAGEL